MAWPRIFQRLFADDGKGPKLRSDILPLVTADAPGAAPAGGAADRFLGFQAGEGGLECVFRALPLVKADAAGVVPAGGFAPGKLLQGGAEGPYWGGLFGRIAQAGEYVLMSGSKLDDNCVWPDGSLIDLAEWPDLKARYEAGYLLTREGASVSATYPGCWTVRSGHAGQLYLPKIGGLFLRFWTAGQSLDSGREAGTYQGDTIRNITGRIYGGSLIHGFTAYEGAIAQTQIQQPYAGAGANSQPTTREINFDASRVVPTAAENRPMNAAGPVEMYLGRHISEV